MNCGVIVLDYPRWTECAETSVAPDGRRLVTRTRTIALVTYAGSGHGALGSQWGEDALTLALQAAGCAGDLVAAWAVAAALII